MNNKIQVVDGTMGRLHEAQQHLKNAEEILTRMCTEGRIPHATEPRRNVYQALLESAQASRTLQFVLADLEERVY